VLEALLAFSIKLALIGNFVFFDVPFPLGFGQGLGGNAQFFRNFYKLGAGQFAGFCLSSDGDTQDLLGILRRIEKCTVLIARMCHTITPERPHCHNNAYPLIDKILPIGGRAKVRKTAYGKSHA
jgi:hypothetical protein